MNIILIAAVGSNGVIGRDNDLPWRISEDWQRFKRITMDQTLVMGRKTYDSIGRPLPGRHTIVITRQSDWSVPGVQVTNSLDNALELAKTSDIFIAGGGEIYRQGLPLADRLEITEVDQAPDGDVTFPDIDPDDWQETARDKHEGFTFVTYSRRSPR